jgi:hypothetical protein
MREHVSIGVRVEAELGRYYDTPENELAAREEAMHIVADAGPKCGHACSIGNASRDSISLAAAQSIGDASAIARWMIDRADSAAGCLQVDRRPCKARQAARK